MESLKKMIYPPKTPAPTICINMIVKNESAIITRMLAAILPLIDEYCICDTGSDDDTINIIRTFFCASGIPGHIVSTPFIDFGKTRTRALQECNRLSACDYILVLDADMVLSMPKGADALKGAMGNADIYSLFQGSDNFMYKNARIFRNAPGYTYWGVTHEYLASPVGSLYDTIDRETAFIRDIGDGGCKSDKFERDERLLLAGLEADPDNVRYTYYLANTYRESGHYAKAIPLYDRRIALGGWKEECWHSLYSKGLCHNNLLEPEKAVAAWILAYDHSPERIESLYELARYYREKCKNKIALAFCKLAGDAAVPDDCLFLQKDVYDYKMAYELSIIGYYCDIPKSELAAACVRVLSAKGVDYSIRENTMANYKFYAPRLNVLSQDAPGALSPENIAVLATIGQGIAEGDGAFVSSTPSVCAVAGNRLIVCVRFVNYRIGDNGEYLNREKIESINVVAVIDTTEPLWEKLSESVLKYDTAKDGLYVGLEDVRLLSRRESTGIFPSMNSGGGRYFLYYNANRGVGDASGDMHVENGRIVIHMPTEDAAGRAVCSMPDQLMYHSAKPLEKNWVLFGGKAGNSKKRCVYSWSPLTIGEFFDTELTLEDVFELPTPPLFQSMRGSTNGLTMAGAKGDEVWFITHLVSHEDRRYYYHCFVVLDRHTCEVLRYTQPFTFEGEKVEYTLGFDYNIEADTFLVGYSVMDRHTRYATVSKESIEAMMMSV